MSISHGSLFSGISLKTELIRGVTAVIKEDVARRAQNPYRIRPNRVLVAPPRAVATVFRFVCDLYYPRFPTRLATNGGARTSLAEPGQVAVPLAPLFSQPLALGAIFRVLFGVFLVKFRPGLTGALRRTLHRAMGLIAAAASTQKELFPTLATVSRPFLGQPDPPAISFCRARACAVALPGLFRTELRTADHAVFCRHASYQRGSGKATR